MCFSTNASYINIKLYYILCCKIKENAYTRATKYIYCHSEILYISYNNCIPTRRVYYYIYIYLCTTTIVYIRHIIYTHTYI